MKRIAAFLLATLFATAAYGQTLGPTPQAWSLLGTQVANNSANNLAFTNIPASSATVFLDCSAIITATSLATVSLQVGEGTGPTWDVGAGAYIYIDTFTLDNSATPITPTNSTGSSGILLTAAGTGLSTSANDIKLFISDLNNSTTFKVALGHTSGVAAGPHYQRGEIFGHHHTDANAITGIRIITSAGNIASGQCSLYALSN